MSLRSDMASPGLAAGVGGEPTGFEVVAPFPPAGDQPQAIAALSEGLRAGHRFQTLLGITGSGKSATIAWTIEAAGRPTLVIAPNKSLAAQLASELRSFFPHNRVEYFVSYYDYYQPEAYVPSSDTYIEKDSSINDDIDRLRHASTSALLTRRDVVVVASVSCIYGLGAPDEYRGHFLYLQVGQAFDQRSLLRRLVELQYERNDTSLVRGRFRVRGDVVDLHPSYEELPVRIEYFGDEVESLSRIDPVTGDRLASLDQLAIFPATHYLASPERLRAAITGIEEELAERLGELHGEGKLLEEQRLAMRTRYDLEMLAEVGTCNGIENYSRHLDGRAPGEMPFTLLDYFPEDFLVVIDESHVTIPQLHGQYEGDHSRKLTLVEHGFRLPSALDNRPLRFEEVLSKIGQAIFLSATPASWELEHSAQVVEQLVRPTGLVDPEVVVRPTEGQIEDLRREISGVVSGGDRVLVTTLTKRMAEDLTEYLYEAGIRVRYLHSDIDTLERIEILRDLRIGAFDVLVGINLLREGLDLPEVALVAILDADKEGFLRSATSLVQTMGRAARNVEGRVIMYADKVTPSMRQAISETERRRVVQLRYNADHGIDPKTVRKAVVDIMDEIRANRSMAASSGGGGDLVAPGQGGRMAALSGKDRTRHGGTSAGRSRGRARAEEKLGAGANAALLADIEMAKAIWGATEQRDREKRGAAPDRDSRLLVLQALEEEMRVAAEELRFEDAAALRDEMSRVLAGEMASRGDARARDGIRGQRARRGSRPPAR